MNKWKDLDFNNIPSDLFTAWDIEALSGYCDIWEKINNCEIIAFSKHDKYRIKPKELSIEDKAREYAKKYKIFPKATFKTNDDDHIMTTKRELIDCFFKAYMAGSKGE